MKAHAVISTSLGALSLALLGMGVAQAQSEIDIPQESASIATGQEPDPATADLARQKVAQSLARLGLRLDWRKASLTELRRTQADLLAAGDDDDTRLRIILAARLREHGIRITWRKFTSEELSDRYADALNAAGKSRESEIVRTDDQPTPLLTQSSQRRRSSHSATNMSEMYTVSTQTVVQPVIIERTVVPVYGVSFPTVYPHGTPTTVRTSDGLTITTYGPPFGVNNGCNSPIQIGIRPGESPTRPIGSPNNISLYPPGAARPGAIPLPRINNRQPDLGAYSVNF
jgi:hypothetical protein